MADDLVGPIRSQVAIIGGGIAGAWLGYRLAQRGIETVLLTDDKGVEPLSRVWAPGLIRQVVLDCTPETAPEVFADISGAQDPGYQAMMVDQLRTEFADLTQLIEYGPIAEFAHPRIKHPGIVLGTGNLVSRAWRGAGRGTRRTARRRPG
jgi:L-aspartate oxidase